MCPALESLQVREEPVKLMKLISALSWHPQTGLPGYELYLCLLALQAVVRD